MVCCRRVSLINIKHPEKKTILASKASANEREFIKEQIKLRLQIFAEGSVILELSSWLVHEHLEDLFQSSDT